MSSSRFLFLVLIGLTLASCGVLKAPHQAIFYNVENLFDTLDTAEKDDAEFLPTGENEWNTEKYTDKLAHINEVIAQFENPLLIGFCEIENAKVVQDVVDYGDLKKDYSLVHFESLDERGIDNSLIYNKSILKLVDSGFIRFDMPDGDRPSRDILWAKFERGNDSLYVLVNHWPSRSGGEVESEPKRIIAATAAKNFIDSLQKINSQVKLLFMGDLNDAPTNAAPKLVMESLDPMIVKSSGKFGGTYNYRGEWDVLDHILLSKGLLAEQGIRALKDSGKIHSFDFLITTYKEQLVPFRTFGGGKYLKGYSDHLPVSIDIMLK